MPQTSSKTDGSKEREREKGLKGDGSDDKKEVLESACGLGDTERDVDRPSRSRNCVCQKRVVGH